MTNWIERFAFPQKLYLAWQAPDHLGDRFRWAVGTIDVVNDQWRLRYLSAGDEFETLNQGRPLPQAIELGYVGYPAFPLKVCEHRDGVEEALMRRVPPRTRPDVVAYKEQFRIPGQLDLPNFAFLAATEAKLPSDGFSVVDPLESTRPNCDLMLEIAGYRYYQSGIDAAQVRAGDIAELCPEPMNQHDPNAVMIQVRGHKVGNINRLQSPTFLTWLRNASLEANIERLNGRADKPRAFVFVRVRPR